MNKLIFGSLLALVLLIMGCSPDPGPVPNPFMKYDNDLLTDIPSNPTSYTFIRPQNFPIPVIPADNPMTAEGIELGRRLFYDPILSGDSTMSCEGCNKQRFAFADNLAVNAGIDGILGERNPPPLFNLAFVPNGLNWDGSSPNLREQAIIPITSTIELHETLENITFKLKRHALYPAWFREAFGIETKGEITDELARKALSQFIRTMVSDDGKLDKVLYNPPGLRPFLTDSERRGEILFTAENVYVLSSSGQVDSLADKECAHCHKKVSRLFTDNSFTNNGLTATPNLLNFPDLGLGGFNGNIADNGKFRTPSLRNIELTAPYMHDGSIETLEEVLDHYSLHLRDSPNLDGILAARLTGTPITFTPQEKTDLINYMKTLTDTTFINNPAFTNPW
jgi:cytochrome c peroxidase